MATVSLSPQQRRTHGVWDVSFERMLEMEAAVEEGQSMGALFLDWSKKRCGQQLGSDDDGSRFKCSGVRENRKNLHRAEQSQSESWKSGAHTAKREDTASCKLHVTALRLH